MTDADELVEIIADLTETLRWEAARGMTSAPRTRSLSAMSQAPTNRSPPKQGQSRPPSKARPQASGSPTPASIPPKPAPPRPAPPSSPPKQGSYQDAWARLKEVPAHPPQAEALRALGEHISQCTACGRQEARRTAFPGQGPADAPLMVVLTEPRAVDEGKGHISSSGMLDRMLERVLGLARRDVRVVGMMRCRPPTGEQTEHRIAAVRACKPYLEQEIKLVQPRFILTFGGLPTRAVLGSDVRPTEVLGQWQQHEGIAVMPTFEIEHLTKHPKDKRTAMQHLMLLKAALA